MRKVGHLATQASRAYYWRFGYLQRSLFRLSCLLAVLPFLEGVLRGAASPSALCQHLNSGCRHSTTVASIRVLSCLFTLRACHSKHTSLGSSCGCICGASEFSTAANAMFEE